MTYMFGHMTDLVGHSPTANLFASDTLVAILTRYALEPKRRFYQRELARAIGSELYSVQRELARLQKMGLLERIPRGRQVDYALHPEHPAWPGLRQVVMRTVAIGAIIAEALSPVREKVAVAWVYGSVARGEDTAGSDIDLMVVGDITFLELASVRMPQLDELGRELNMTAYETDDFLERLTNGHRFVTDVVDSPKVWVIGDDSELERVVGSETNRATENECPGDNGADRGGRPGRSRRPSRGHLR